MATWERVSGQRFATIHHHNLLSHGNDLINATDSSTNERLLTCCYWLQCQFPVPKGEKKIKVTSDDSSDNAFHSKSLQLNKTEHKIARMRQNNAFKRHKALTSTY